MKVSKSPRKTGSKSKLYASNAARQAADENEAIARGGVATPFPWKLHEMLEDASKEGNDWIVSWQSHGRSFIVHKPKVFVEKIMPTYFNQSKFASFQRQLNLYGFNRLTAGSDKGAYYHDFFIRGQRALCRGMVRQKIKGTKVRRTLSPEEEPNFYTMANVLSSTPPPLDFEVDDAPQENSPVQEPTGKDRALQLRQERLETVRDVLQQTEQLCEEHSIQDDFDMRAQSIASSIPSVSPAESEESDSEESHVYAMSPNNKSTQQQVLPSLELAPLEPREARFTPTAAKGYMQGGDLLFFEGKPFHYLEHLDAVPQAPTGYPNKQNSGFYQRDTLHSLMRVDPKSIIGSAF